MNIDIFKANNAIDYYIKLKNNTLNFMLSLNDYGNVCSAYYSYFKNSDTKPLNNFTDEDLYILVKTIFESWIRKI